MGWFRLFDRLRLRPMTETPEGWALPGSALRMTDPHLAAYFRNLITNLGVSARVDIYDVVSHAFARALPPQRNTEFYRFHVDLRAVGPQAALMFGDDNHHAILSWHAMSRSAQLCLPGSAPASLREVDLLAMLRANLPVSDIATLSARLARAEAIPGVLAALSPWLTDQTLALIRLPGETLPALVALLPTWPVQPVAMLPCEPESDDPANAMPDVLLCLCKLSKQTMTEALATAAERDHKVSATTWVPGSELGQDGGLNVTPLSESRSVGYVMPISLLGDAPPTTAGAAFYAMQRHPARAEAAHGLRFELQSASLFAHEGAFVAVPLVGPAVFDPDLAVQPVLSEQGFSRHGLLRDIELRPTILLGCANSHADFAAQIWPKLELAFDLIERDKLAPAEICLLLPAGVDSWTLDALALCGFGAECIRTAWEGVLFRQLIMASPACDLTALRCVDMFDRFWQRVAAMAQGGHSASFTAPRSSGRVMLLCAASTLLNAAELAAFARSRAYRVIDPDTTSAAELAETLRYSSVVVVERESAIWSAYASSAALGLLQSDTDPEIPYAALHAAAARGHQLSAMFGSAIGISAQSSYVVALDRFAALLDRLENRIGGAGA